MTASSSAVSQYIPLEDEVTATQVVEEHGGEGSAPPRAGMVGLLRADGRGLQPLSPPRRARNARAARVVL